MSNIAWIQEVGVLYDKMFVSKCDDVSNQKWSISNAGRFQNNGHGKYIGSAWCYIEIKADECRAVELRYYEEDGNCGTSQTWTLSVVQSQAKPTPMPTPIV